MSTCNRLLKAAAYIVYVHSHQSLLHHMFKEVVSQKQRIRLETFSGFYRSCSYCEVYKSSQNFSKSSHMINLGNQPKSEKMEMKLKRHLCKKNYVAQFYLTCQFLPSVALSSLPQMLKTPLGPVSKRQTSCQSSESMLRYQLNVLTFNFSVFSLDTNQCHCINAGSVPPRLVRYHLTHLMDKNR